ncbi:hypothetical protein DFH09DRAFT_1154861 [Mycena vulgaris]|nr:hypothetical protein DFH09DRAFT_1154861 [Mycena vulgaris]
MRGFFLRSIFTRGAGGTHVPFAIASSTAHDDRGGDAEEEDERCEEGVYCKTLVRLAVEEREMEQTVELGRGLRAAVRVGVRRGPAGGERGRHGVGSKCLGDAERRGRARRAHRRGRRHRRRC